MSLPKVPAPPAVLDFDEYEDLVHPRGVLWRVFAASGEHPSRWNEFRYWGPVKKMRFDLHPQPVGMHDRGVMYTAFDALTPIAEVFQSSRRIDARTGPGSFDYIIAGWIPVRTLRLLNLASSRFPIRNGASAQLSVGVKRYTQEWANRIDEQLGDRVDGIWSWSPMTVQPMATLFNRAADSFPRRPEFLRLLGDPAAGEIVGKAAEDLRYGITT